MYGCEVNVDVIIFMTALKTLVLYFFYSFYKLVLCIKERLFNLYAVDKANIF